MNLIKKRFRVLSKRFKKSKKEKINPSLFHYRKPFVRRKKSEIELYNRFNLQDCPWPKNSDGDYAKKYFAPFILQGPEYYIKNIHTDLQLLVWDQLILPITINYAEYENSYVCSPYSFYISYASSSLDFIKQNWIKVAIQKFLKGMGKILHSCQFNKVISINNWFFSTNLYPNLSTNQLEKITTFLKERFPHHTIIFRSIAKEVTPFLYQSLPKLKYDLIASRPIFFIDPIKQQELLSARLYKSDLKLLKNSGYTILKNHELTEQDIPRLVELYQTLYIDKYSQLNPQFTEEFVRLVLTNNLMHFRALKKEGKIDGVIAFIIQNNKLFCPYLGYDQTLPPNSSLYRLLSTILMQEAQERYIFFHQSAGASVYKKIRKGQSAIEYLAVNSSHLSFKQKIPWSMLRFIYNSVGRYYMQFY